MVFLFGNRRRLNFKARPNHQDMNIRFIQILLSFFMFLIAYHVDGQSTRVPAGLAKFKYFQISGRVRLEKGDPSGTIVKLTDLDSKQSEKSLTLSSSGKFDLELDYFKEYKMSVSKSGYYEKEIDISTMIPRNIWDKDSIFPPFPVIVSLYEKVEGVKLSFEGKPIGKLTYSPNGKLDNFDSTIQIDDQSIQDEINDARKNITDKLFNQKVAEALEFEKKDDLSSAYSLYSEAIKLKPSDKFVKDKLKELASDLKNLVSEAKIMAEFNRFIALGDGNVAILKYLDAIQNYKSALKIKPKDPVAVEKLVDAEKLLALAGEKAKQEAEKAKREAEFSRLIAAGDESVKQTKYPEAITSFKSALAIKPGDAMALARIADTEKLLALAGEKAKQEAEKAKREAEFARLIAAGDESVKQTKYPEAITSFKSALTIKPGDAVALARIADTEKLLALAGEKAKQEAEKAKREAEFSRLIAAGDESVKQTKYPEAITSFKSALAIKPGDAMALARIANAEKLLALAGEKAKQEAEKAKREAEFSRLIAAGDESVKQTKYPEAITSFKSALTIKPGDAMALARIADAEKLLALAGEKAKQEAEKAKREAEFTRLIAAGDESVKQTKYPEAITSFKSALAIKPGDAMALARIANAEKLLALAGEKAKQEAEKAKREAEFARLIAAGDESVKQTKYPEAITSFKSALTIKPGDAMALARIADAEKLLALAGEKAKQEAEKAKREAEFTRLIAAGDESVKQTKYPEAITSFKSALTIKPGDAMALARIADAEKLLALAGEKAKQEAEKAKREAEFTRLIAAGDESVKQTKYPEAITSFKSALAIKPGDTVALARIADAEKLFALAGEKAKQEAEKAKREAEFARLIAAGDESVKQTKYPEAITSFKSALTIKPGDAMALARIADAEKLLALAGEKAKQEAEKAKREAEFTRLIAAGDESVKQTKYPEAITSFKSALTIKPGDAMALARIADAEKLLALAGEKAKQEAEKAKREAEFTRLIAAGDESVKQTKYPEAITSFKSALAIKPGDTIALARIADAEKLLALAGEKAKREAEKAKREAEFSRLIAAGDESVKQTKYPEAITSFKSALTIKPGDTVALARIADAEKLLALAGEKAKQEAEKAKREAEFSRLIAAGDESVKQTKYPEAITSFKSALTIKPGDTVALARIADAEKLLALAGEKAKQEAEKAKREAEFSRLIAAGDARFSAKQYDEALMSYKSALKLNNNEIVKSKISETERLIRKAIDESKISSVERSYADKINTADENFKKSQWSVARFYYFEALKIRQNDSYSLQRIDACDKMIDSGVTAEKMAEYQNKLAKADLEMKANNLSSARFYYHSALDILKWETYPQQQLKEIDRIISGKLSDSDQKLYKENLDKAEEAFNRKEYPSARFYYNKALGLNSSVLITDRLKEIESILNGSESQKLNAEYNSLILKGEEAVKQNNSVIARFYFQKAIALKPSENYPREALRKIDAGVTKP